jgi:hypothetical protein
VTLTDLWGSEASSEGDNLERFRELLRAQKTSLLRVGSESKRDNPRARILEINCRRASGSSSSSESAETDMMALPSREFLGSPIYYPDGRKTGVDVTEF